MGSEFPTAFLTATNFRALAAVAMRREGMTFGQVGERLGVGQTQARSLFQRGERLLKSPRFNHNGMPEVRHG